MILEDYLEPASYDAAFWMAGVYNPEFPLDQLGDLSLEVCEKIRALAITVLVTSGNSNAFFHNLIRSGRVRVQYLERCLRENGLAEHHRASGRYAALLDSIAAGDYALAIRIGELSPLDFMSGHEYEDDYCYAQLIHCFASGEEKRVQALLDRFERYTEGGANTRLDLMRALSQRSQENFETSFEQLLLDRSREIKINMERGQLEEPQVIAERRIYIEGLAILKLAEKLGLNAAGDYLFCPAIARVAMTAPFPGE